MKVEQATRVSDYVSDTKMNLVLLRMFGPTIDNSTDDIITCIYKYRSASLVIWTFYAMSISIYILTVTFAQPHHRLSL